MAGRETETAEITRRLTAGRSHSEVLILTGDPGTGKSTLLDFAADHTRREGGQVLRAAGTPSETHLDFAALHQMLHPVLGELDNLPPRQRAALRTVLRLDEPTRPPDGMLTGSALITLATNLARHAPLLLIIDDAQWIDRASLDVISFTARRMNGQPITLLAGVRAAAALPGLDEGHRHLQIGPLNGEAANRLLDRQPAPPTGRTRTRILQEAAGNPLALIELTRAAATRPPAGSGIEGPLPITDRLEQIYAEQARSLPEATRRTLLLLAAADTTDVPAAAHGLPEADDTAWAPAEQARLLRQDGPRITFRHPLIRSAVYHAASLEERRQAHLTLARHSQEPDRRAWHLAAATTRPDETISAALRQTADRARRRGGHAAATAALQRAAELNPHRAHQARLLTEAAATAVYTGQLGWVEHLAAQVRRHSDDPALTNRASLATAQLMTLRRHHTAAFAQLTRLAREAAATCPPRVLDALAAAAIVRYYSGEQTQLHQIHDLLPAAPDSTTEGTLHAWVRAISDPSGTGASITPALPALIAEAADDPARLTALAAIAWILDHTALATSTFDQAHDRWQTRGSLPDGLGCAVGWAYLEQGRWTEARAVAAEITAMAQATGLDHAEACAQALDATTHALLGDTTEARHRAQRALTLIDPLQSRSITVAAHRALGLAAAAEGDHDTAYTHFRSAFTGDGDPVHYHVSYTVLAELAASAARRGHHKAATGLLERSAQHLGTGASARITALLDRGRALLAAPGHAEPYFQAALADETGEQRPFERAQTRLDYGEWLRRQRRITEARPLLTSALDTFQRLGARPWATRAQAELRAAGIDAAGGAAPGGLTELSPQQQQIVRLAALGLTNREIGERLYLSPRTVGSHLYRVFPKLGVTARSQLRDVIEHHDRVPI
ncbi:LuxR family transcriptional regulator [Spongiactinospora rosea]|uniref:LuxR family transcriptional regulator n=1 Tax=Spongiactinospora rosea TaxID=2248750 RepID=A0A366M059_9ACTN|nr:LuxR family transcriptional regulator [Spongiactinospora rosea]RBQ18812.1 LuxR family transcriptional regulator [Spongiactinospora rosea]